VDVLAQALALVNAAPADVTDEWDLGWHLGPVVERTPAEQASARAWLEARRADLDWLDGRLHDDASRRTLVRLLAHRLAGSRRILLGVGRDTSEQLTRFAATALARDPPHAEPALAQRPFYDLGALGLDLRVAALPMFAIHTFLLEQYRHTEIAEANVRAGDVVVDGGAFWGDTALWLADQCAPDGHVIAFEADARNLPVLEANLRLNPEAGERVEVRLEALWHAQTRLNLSGAGAAASVDAGAGAGPGTPAVSLDALRRAGTIGDVDFIKLDIEGAEVNALRGASELISERAPRLAIAVYHRADDLLTIPRLLDELAPDYRFAITHRSLHQFDTVLFAWR